MGVAVEGLSADPYPAGLIPKRTATEPSCSEFAPEAALVNYYAVGDSLGGHSDDVEADLSKPIVSISLGCDAVFLQGGMAPCCDSTCFTLCLMHFRDAEEIQDWRNIGSVEIT